MPSSDPSATRPLLELRDVHTHIGHYHILHGVNLTVPEGRLTMLLGRNGAGKTTTLRTIMGLWRASAGTIAFDNAPIQARATPDIARLGIAYVPEAMGIFAGLTVRENMLLATGPGGFHDRRLERVFLLFPVLKAKWHQHAGSLSGGQKQMLAISRAIVEERRLLIVDEPTKGLAPAVIGHLIEAFQELKRQRTTILLVEQNFHMARSLGDDVAVMDDGRVVHAGRMEELAADEALQAQLLGLTLGAHQ
jgi:branched-chain amino acid transport system ATP-binding protein